MIITDNGPKCLEREVVELEDGTATVKLAPPSEHHLWQLARVSNGRRLYRCLVCNTNVEILQGNGPDGC